MSDTHILRRGRGVSGQITEEQIKAAIGMQEFIAAKEDGRLIGCGVDIEPFINI
jgi:hypothetical protein